MPGTRNAAVTLTCLAALALVPVPVHAQQDIVPALGISDLKVEHPGVSPGVQVIVRQHIQATLRQTFGDSLYVLTPHEREAEGRRRGAAQSGRDSARDLESGNIYMASGQIAQSDRNVRISLQIRRSADDAVVAELAVAATLEDLLGEVDAGMVQLTGQLAKALHQPLDAPQQTVTFASTPPAAVFVDGRLTCLQTPCTALVPLGRPSVTMISEHTVPRSERLKVDAATREITWQLERYALVTVLCDSQVATQLDNRIEFTGRSCPQVDLSVRPGEHRLAVRKQWDEPVLAQLSFKVAPGEHKVVAPPAPLQDQRERQSVRQPFVSPMGRFSTLNLTAHDRKGKALKASASLDGVVLGDVPGRYLVPYDGKELVISSAGRTSWSGRPRGSIHKETSVEVELPVTRRNRPKLPEARAWYNFGAGRVTEDKLLSDEAVVGADELWAVEEVPSWGGSALRHHPNRQLSGPVADAMRRVLPSELTTPSATPARVEAFLLAHFADPARAPLAEFRLAQLYEQQSRAMFAYEMFVYERETGRYDQGKRIVPPEYPEFDGAAATALYASLRRPRSAEERPRWPDFAYADAALYGEQMVDDRWECKPLRQLVAEFPDSSYALEAWTQIGERSLEDQQDYDDGAFQHAATLAVRRNDDAAYVFALHRLGWLAYLRYGFPLAIERFRTLLDYEVAHEATLSAAARAVGVHDEAAATLAKALAEPIWDHGNRSNFGSEDDGFAWWSVDSLLHAQLYAASLVAPGLEAERMGRAETTGQGTYTFAANAAERDRVRKLLLTENRPYYQELLLAAARVALAQDDELWANIAAIWLHALVEHYPLARQAEEAQRKLITAADQVAEGASEWRADQVLVRSANAVLAPQYAAAIEAGLKRADRAWQNRVTERERYLALVAAGAPWHTRWASDPNVAAEVAVSVSVVRQDLAAILATETTVTVAPSPR